MLRIVTKHNEYEFEYKGIKIIQSDFPSKDFKILFDNDSLVYIDNIHIKKDDIVYISELTKTDEFINLSKKSFLHKDIDQSDDLSLINYENVNKLIDNINNKYDYELLTINDGDINKIISLLLDVNDLGYLNLELLKIFLDNDISESKKLIIFDNVSWINIEFLNKYLNNYHFIILTNDIRYYLKRKEMLEIVINKNSENQYIDFLSFEKVIAYLEKNLNEEFDDKKFNDFINKKNSLLSIRCLELIKKI